MGGRPAVGWSGTAAATGAILVGRQPHTCAFPTKARGSQSRHPYYISSYDATHHTFWIRKLALPRLYAVPRCLSIRPCALPPPPEALILLPPVTFPTRGAAAKPPDDILPIHKALTNRRMRANAPPFLPTGVALPRHARRTLPIRLPESLPPPLFADTSDASMAVCPSHLRPHASSPLLRTTEDGLRSPGADDDAAAWAGASSSSRPSSSTNASRHRPRDDAAADVVGLRSMPACSWVVVWIGDWIESVVGIGSSLWPHDRG